ncbi:MAG: transposase, partial [Acidobacteriota bacterium]|nr:transposase [Acidobacteriota bacterium]
MMPEEPAARGAPCPSLPVHVTIGTHRRLPVFADEAVALNVYLLVREHPLTLAAVLMPNHLHWLLARSADLERTVERFKTHSTRRAEAAGHQGRLWQPSYFDALVEPESRLRRIAAYLLTNPVAAELAPSWGEYPWACLHPS